ALANDLLSSVSRSDSVRLVGVVPQIFVVDLVAHLIEATRIPPIREVSQVAATIETPHLTRKHRTGIAFPQDACRARRLCWSETGATCRPFEVTGDTSGLARKPRLCNGATCCVLGLVGNVFDGINPVFTVTDDVTRNQTSLVKVLVVVVHFLRRIRS